MTNQRSEELPPVRAEHPPRTAWWRALPATTLVVGLIGLIILIVAPSSTASAQEASDVEATTVTVSEEPGVCTELGAFCERLMAWTGNEALSETIAWLVSTPLKILLIVVLAGIANRWARRMIKRIVSGIEDDGSPVETTDERTQERTDERAQTMGALLRSGSSMIIFVVAGILILENLGISIMPFLASLGIAGLAVGFGAQKLIEDLISGVMIVVEDQLGIGDNVDVGVVSGTVERLTLRSTVILDGAGVRWYVPNSEIRRVANESQHETRAKVTIGIAYGSDLPRAVDHFHAVVIDLVADDRWTTVVDVSEIPPPFVSRLDDHAIVLEMQVPIASAQRSAFERALRERLLEAAASAGIEPAHPKLDIWLRNQTAEQPA